MLSLLNTFAASWEESGPITRSIIENVEYKTLSAMCGDYIEVYTIVSTLIDERIADIGFAATEKYLPDFLDILISGDTEKLQVLYGQILNLDRYDSVIKKIKNEKAVILDEFTPVVDVDLPSTKIVDKDTLFQALEKRYNIELFLDHMADRSLDEYPIWHDHKNSEKLVELEVKATLYFLDKLDKNDYYKLFVLLKKIHHKRFSDVEKKLSVMIIQSISSMSTEEIALYVNFFAKECGGVAQLYYRRDQVFYTIFESLSERFSRKEIDIETILCILQESDLLYAPYDVSQRSIIWLLEDINNTISYNSERLNPERQLSIPGVAWSYRENNEILFKREKTYHLLCNFMKKLVVWLEEERLIEKSAIPSNHIGLIKSLDEYNFPQRWEETTTSWSMQKPQRRWEEHDIFLLRLIQQGNMFDKSKIFFIAQLCGSAKSFNNFISLFASEKAYCRSSFPRILSIAKTEALEKFSQLLAIHSLKELESIVICENETSMPWFDRESLREVVSVDNPAKLNIFEWNDIVEIADKADKLNSIGYFTDIFPLWWLASCQIDTLLAEDIHRLPFKSYRYRYDEDGNPPKYEKLLELMNKKSQLVQEDDEIKVYEDELQKMIKDFQIFVKKRNKEMEKFLIEFGEKKRS